MFGCYVVFVLFIVVLLIWLFGVVLFVCFAYLIVGGDFGLICRLVVLFYLL